MGKTKSVVLILLLLLLEVRGEGDQKYSEDSWWQIVKDSAAAAAAATGAVQLGLSTAGFSAAGPVAGSLAAGFQASIGNVVAGSIFATCQSVAMTGVITTLGGPAVIVGGGVGAAYFIYRAYRKNKTKGNVPFVPMSLMMYGFTPKCTIPDYFDETIEKVGDAAKKVTGQNVPLDLRNQPEVKVIKTEEASQTKLESQNVGDVVKTGITITFVSFLVGAGVTKIGLTIAGFTLKGVLVLRTEPLHRHPQEVAAGKYFGGKLINRALRGLRY